MKKNLGCLLATVSILQLIQLTFTVEALPPIVKIGALFTHDQRNSSTELAFKYAVYKINKEKIILPKTTLVYDIQYVPKDDSFHASKKACQQVKFGVQAIFGPSNPILGQHIHSICDALDIPHLEARVDLDTEAKEFSINLHPAQTLLNNAYQDIMAFLNWTKVAIMYEEDYGLIKLRELARSPKLKDIEIYMRQADPGTYKQILTEAKSKEIQNFIVDTKSENMHLFLKMVLQLQMNDYKYHYLFTSFDIETFDLEEFKYNFVNITAFRLVDADDNVVRGILKDMERFQPAGNTILHKSRIIEAEPALMYDSVQVFAVGLRTLEQSHALRPANLSCELEHPWDGGLSLINYINSVEIKGISGPIEFKEGQRIQFKLDLLKLKQHSLVKVGEWQPSIGINVTDAPAFFEPGLTNVTLVVITILEQPYVMLKSGGNFSGNERYEGFCIDLLRNIAELVGFTYRIELVPDGKYGVYDYETGEWNGIVRQLMDKKADLAVGSMTINYARESVIDFTKPFMNLGISILFKVPTSHPARLFSFMNPLAIEIWLYVLAAYVLVSVTMFVVARFSPYEWNNPHPCHAGPEIVENQFSLSNSFWFTIGTLMQQGSDLNPKATSTRIVSGIWWFFTLIIISSYTANLAAFLTVERMITPIENAEDLASQTDISYGTLDSGSTMTFFRDSMIETYKKMWRFMENKKPSVFVPTYEEGIQRVLQGQYAFLMESTMLDYIVQRDCNLTQIGGLLDSKGYGIATPMGSPWRDKISLAILELQEKGETQALYDHWWKSKGETCMRTDKGKESKANALGVDNIGGVFVVLLCGLAFAVLIAIFEFCYNSKKNAPPEQQHLPAPPPTCSGSLQGLPQNVQQQPQSHHQQESLCAEMARELCRALRCRAPSRRRKACEKCSTHVISYHHSDNPTPTPINGIRTQTTDLGVPVELSPHIHMHHHHHHHPSQDYDGN
ncbi:glutamate receptor ionotropic, kainate 2-like isoform X2 [Leptopilina heterotoma]|uniref:glutamate receptor ionotropic, kainate 2-like isoform X1 n=1 Tax=Leptopilina heterotoma TaxID=63436 RepID=UPI001CA93CE7|nr:glutamate receptor ionotropic, kainate 2-like isoform X1 [Leptopilina heterotoma]XP_043478894.1 glutamate receptor ionotropic, kainate 2-like isoform X1 [Leptopilina heterotoma]XP_043478895.1 glutamate receptor ionotropic, kainate 2-like isoform X2 [Leptopilina heterotoma]